MNQDKIENLVERSKQRDMAAFRELVTVCQPFVFRIAFRLLCSSDEAKDVVQETFVRVWLHLHKYTGRARFSTWICKITCNLCYERLREIKRQRNMCPEDIDLSELNLPSDEDIEQSVINVNLKELIIGMVHELTPRQRLVFTLKDIECLEVEEIKDITGMSAGKIKSNLYLARQYIRKRINMLINK